MEKFKISQAVTNVEMLRIGEAQLGLMIHEAMSQALSSKIVSQYADSLVVEENPEATVFTLELVVCTALQLREAIENATNSGFQQGVAATLATKQ